MILRGDLAGLIFPIPREGNIAYPLLAVVVLGNMLVVRDMRVHMTTMLVVMNVRGHVFRVMLRAVAVCM